MVVERFKERKLREATPRKASDFLMELAMPVVKGQKKRQVLSANLLEEGKAGPLSPEQQVIRTIPFEGGWFFVSDRTWEEAIDLFAQDMGCNLESSGMTKSSKSGTGLRVETAIPAEEEKVALVRVEEYDPNTGKLVLLGFEIVDRKAFVPDR